MTANTYGFDIVGEKVGDHHKSLARFTCTGCGATQDEVIKSGFPLAPEMLAKGARQRGWDADQSHRNRTLCPRCKQNKEPNDPDSELKKMIAKQKANGTNGHHEHRLVPIHNPTSEQRAAIRTLLDKHFDADDGYYLGEWSDQKIAEHLNLPRVIIENLRDLAYGPIKITPEQMAVRNEVAAIKAEIEALRSEHKALSDQLVADCDKLSQKVDALATRKVI